MVAKTVAGFSPLLRAKAPPFRQWDIRVEFMMEKLQQIIILVTQNL